MAYGVTLIMIKHLGFFRGDVCSQFLRPRPYLRASGTRHKAVVSKFIVSQARPHQKTQLFFLKVTNFACANWQMRLLSCMNSSLVPSPPPQLSSVTVRITLLTIFVLQATTAAVPEGRVRDYMTSTFAFLFVVSWGFPH